MEQERSAEEDDSEKAYELAVHELRYAYPHLRPDVIELALYEAEGDVRAAASNLSVQEAAAQEARLVHQYPQSSDDASHATDSALAEGAHQPAGERGRSTSQVAHGLDLLLDWSYESISHLVSYARHYGNALVEVRNLRNTLRLITPSISADVTLLRMQNPLDCVHFHSFLNSFSVFGGGGASSVVITF